ncbi:capsule biosynthesis protein CapA [Lachnospiraceae bacterium]|nr:capsule biosynthesis protein CapA [Lachnospiraceae bacterium]
MGHKIRKKIFLLLLCLGLSGCASWPGQDIFEYSGHARQEAAADGGSNQSLLSERAVGVGSNQSLLSEEAVGGGSDQGLPSENGHGTGNLSAGEESASAEISESAGDSVDRGYDFTICFAGDINLDENWYTTQFLDTQPGGIYDCISPELVEVMQAADIMCLNNEFTYSAGGSPLAGKAYTFRADPGRVEVLEQLGVDAVTLANNHVYDYGPEALLDTFTVLEEAGVPYFGAGRTLEEAMKPLYLEVEGRTVALVAASRAEKYKMTPQATETEPGILRCYDTELFLQAIREAKANADFCIAFVHWGTEYSYDLEQVQLDTGRAYLDAGADAVIGAHSHCLQGMEYYDGKPIVYSLGNYWFNEKTLDTMLLQLHFSGDEAQARLEVQVIPAVQSGCRTTYAQEEEERRRIFDFLESISVNVEISHEGMVAETG